MRIALAGNPNSGKTTMYNGLTGKNEKVGNWAGVTVDKKESPIKKSLYNGSEELIAVDLPGAYSMSPFTSEESVTRDYIKTQKPDVIINIVDATNLSRSLFFTTQLLELGMVDEDPIRTVTSLGTCAVNPNNKVKIGNYPLLSAYVNFDLKRTRFYVQYYHANQSDGRYFWAPGYPMNPGGLHFGLSWNFYD